MEKSFVVRKGDTVVVAGLPSEFQLPNFPSNVIVTGIYIMVNSKRVSPGETVTIHPDDIVSFHYETTDLPVITFSGSQIMTASLDGQSKVVGDDGSIVFDFTTFTEDHTVMINGRQPQPYILTFNDHGSTQISVNGEKVTNSTKYETLGNAFIEAESLPIDVHFHVIGDVTVQVDGKVYADDDFNIAITEPTEIDINAAVCNLTIDYGDSSYTLKVPQSVIQIAAVHRDGWNFDCWSSVDVGIASPKLVQTTVDLTGVDSATLVCHYQRCKCIDKPNLWN